MIKINDSVQRGMADAGLLGMRLMLGGMPGDPAIAAMLKDFRSRD